MRILLCLSILFCLFGCEAAPGPEPAPAAPAAPDSSEPHPEEVPLLSEGPRLAPVDEAPADPSFLRFREELVQIVRQRDTDRLLEVVAPEIRFTFGSGGGREDFIEHWNLREGDSELWDQLGPVLSLGGSFQETRTGDRFSAPYIYSDWPGSVDAFQFLAVTCPDAVVRAAPEKDADPIYRLDYHLLRAARDASQAPPQAQGPARAVVLPDGRAGWVDEECVRSHLDYRAGFERRGGEWRMVLLVAGD